MGKHLVSVGDLVIDLILPVSLPLMPAQHQDVSFLRMEPGGASSAMIAARRMGLAVSTIGATGDDLFGTQILAVLQAEGINTDGVVTGEDSTATVVIVLTDQASGEHVFVGHYGRGAPAPYSETIDQRVRTADALFIQGYSLYEARVVEMGMRAVERARELGIPVFFDVGPSLALVPQERRKWMVEHSDVILMTEDEVPMASDGLSGAEAYRLLFDRGAQVLVVKQGARGCTLVRPDSAAHIPGFAVEVVDTVGAGDCFDAAFIAGRLHNLSWEDCALLANAMGAAAVRKVGAGTNAPTCAEVMAVLAGASQTIPYPC